jgi:hypothetical protein
VGINVVQTLGVSGKIKFGTFPHITKERGWNGGIHIDPSKL